MILSTFDLHHYNKLERWGELLLRDDGYFGTPDSYWSISQKNMQRLVKLGLVRIDRIGQSTFAVKADSAA